MVSRNPRQIVGFDVAFDKSPDRIQNIVDNASTAERYYTDGFLGYVDIIYPGKHIRNVRDKSNTYTVEGVNADLRHYIPVLARHSRSFARKLDTLKAVIDVFVDAYNQFGTAKHVKPVNYHSHSSILFRRVFVHTFKNDSVTKPMATKKNGKTMLASFRKY